MLQIKLHILTSELQSQLSTAKSAIETAPHTGPAELSKEFTELTELITCVAVMYTLRIRLRPHVILVTTRKW